MAGGGGAGGWGAWSASSCARRAARESSIMGRGRPHEAETKKEGLCVCRGEGEWGVGKRGAEWGSGGKDADRNRDRRGCGPSARHRLVRSPWT